MLPASRRAAALAVFAAAWAAFSGLGAFLSPRKTRGDGDAGEYLLMARSLAEDGDLDLAGDAPPAPNRLLLRDGRVVANRAPGLPAFLLPFRALLGERGPGAAAALAAALLVSSLFLSCLELTGRAGLSAAAAAAAALSFPILPFSGEVHPGLLSAFLAAETARFLLSRDDAPFGASEALRALLPAALLPWIHFSNFPLAAALSTGVLLRAKSPRAALLPAAAALICALGALALSARFMISGLGGASSACLMAFDVPIPAFTWSQMASGLPGLLFDRAKGLLTYAPAYALGLAGLPLLFRRRPGPGGYFFCAAILLHIAWISAYACWPGAYSLPGRMLLPAAPLLLLPAALALERARKSPALLALSGLLVLWGLLLAAQFLRSPDAFYGADGAQPLRGIFSPDGPLRLMLRWPSYMAAHVRVSREASPAAGGAVFALGAGAALAALAALLLRAEPAPPPPPEARGAPLRPVWLLLVWCLPLGASVATLAQELGPLRSAARARRPLPAPEAARLEEFLRMGQPARKPPPIETVLVPGGPFIRGSFRWRRSNGARHFGYPAQVKELPAFRIGRREITHEQYSAFLRDTGFAPPNGWASAEPPPGKSGHPVTGLSWLEAAAFCRWAGGRLPSEDEWEKAARWGPGESPERFDDRLYPWGDRPRDPGRLRSLESGEAGPAPAGSLPLGASRYGALDMAGNVPEFCADEHELPGWKALRGGGWYLPAEYCHSILRMGAPAAERGDYGFRIVLP